MPLAERVQVLAGSWRADALLAAGLGLSSVAFMAAQGVLHGTSNLIETCCGLGVCASLAARRQYPKLAAGAAACCLALTVLGNSSDLPDDLILAPVFLLAYSLGAAADVASSAVVAAGLVAGAQAAIGLTVFNPFILVATLGPFALGLVVRSRRRIADQLAARGRELEEERELFAAEAVRYERARIARELHDIVAHCISVMVIQASAGQRASATDPALAAEAFDAISEAVGQAGAEIGRLVEMLGHDPQPRHTDSLRLVDELVARAGAAGLDVSCRFAGTTDGLTERARDAAYRVVQESLTNALKHAPGAPVEVLIAEAGGHAEVRVVNGPATATATGLHRAGGGHGLAGMRERVGACGGDLSAGPVESGGWQVLARLPRPAEPLPPPPDLRRATEAPA